MIDLDRTLDTMTQAITALDAPELHQWLLIVNVDKDPRTLPGFRDFAELFTHTGSPMHAGQWPVMHLIIKLAFIELVKSKLETSGLELELQQ